MEQRRQGERVRHRAVAALIALGLLAGLITGRPEAAFFPDSSSHSPDPPRLSFYWSYRILRWEDLILQEANHRGLDPDFLASLVWMESRGEANAIGPLGSVGLMQVMPQEKGFSWRPSTQALLDPSLNLFWGARILATVIQQGDGDVFHALAAYNAGWEKSTHSRPHSFATTILRDYAHAVATRCGVSERWVAFFAVQGYIIRGPIWVADSARQDVYFFGQTNVTLEGTPLIPSVPPTAVVARFDAADTGSPQEVGIWLYEVQRNVWSRCTAAAGTATVTPTATVVPPTAFSMPTVTPGPTATPAARRTTGPTAEAVVRDGGADVRPGATRWWDPVATLAAGTPLRLLGYNPATPDWVYVSTWENTVRGWVQTATLKLQHDLNILPLMTPVPTLTPTLTATPTPSDTPTPSATPTVACTGEPLWAEAWPLRTANTADGWMAVVYIGGHGGNCVYTYAWNEEENVVGGPRLDGITFEVHIPNRAANIVGTAVVMSGNETVRVGVFIKPPDSNE